MSAHVSVPPHRPAARWVALAGFGLAAASAALIGTLAVTGTRSRYAALELPGWAPPSWLFGPVWTLLYAMIAVAGWLVWQRVGWRPVLLPYAAQLILNAAWTPIFFGAGRYGWALLDIAAMWLAIVATMVAFWPVSRRAVALLAPYLAWVSFAAALNAAIWAAN